MYLTSREINKTFLDLQDQIISFLFHIHENTTSNCSALPGHSWLSPDTLPPTTLYPPIPHQVPWVGRKGCTASSLKEPSYPPDDQAMFSLSALTERAVLPLSSPNYQCHRPRCEQTRTSIRWGYPSLSILFLKVFMVLFSPFSNRTFLPLLSTILALS